MAHMRGAERMEGMLQAQAPAVASVLVGGSAARRLYTACLESLYHSGSLPLWRHCGAVLKALEARAV